MQIKSIKNNKKNIVFVGLYNSASDNVESEEERKVICKELPMQSFGEALQMLNLAVIEVMEFSKDYVQGMVIDGFAISFTKHGTRSLEVYFTKALDSIGGNTHKLKTPFFRIDAPSDGENGSVEVSKDVVKHCCAAILEAELYAKGDRSQMTFEQYNEENGALKLDESEPALI